MSGRLALAELKRAGGFDKSMLVIVTPTGTGWIDPAAIDAVEYLQNGDVASVAMQYSYLSSPLSLIAHPEYGAEASRALWSGPPFASLTWQRVTHERVPGSPQWLPEFRDSRLFRFMSQYESPVPADTPLLFSIHTTFIAVPIG